MKIMIETKIKMTENRGTEYLEMPDGLRLIFQSGKYIGWYLP